MTPQRALPSAEPLNAEPTLGAAAATLRQTLVARRVLLAYVAAVLVMSVLDALWLGWLAKDFYQHELGSLMRAQIWLTPALLFYLLYPAGLVLLALWPLPLRAVTALWRSALVGLVAYGTYDLTNMATLPGFSARLALVDMAWGTVASALAGWAGWALARLR